LGLMRGSEEKQQFGKFAEGAGGKGLGDDMTPRPF
jgi:hypothetical protein